MANCYPAHGGHTINDDVIPYENGTTVTSTAVPSTGWKFVEWRWLQKATWYGGAAGSGSRSEYCYWGNEYLPFGKYVHYSISDSYWGTLRVVCTDLVAHFSCETKHSALLYLYVSPDEALDAGCLVSINNGSPKQADYKYVESESPATTSFYLNGHPANGWILKKIIDSNGVDIGHQYDVPLTIPTSVKYAYAVFECNGMILHGSNLTILHGNNGTILHNG